MMTVQVDELPLQAPDQPAKAEPVWGVAVSVTVLFGGKAAAQGGAQLMPDGLLLTKPNPSPALVTSSREPWANVAVTVLSALSVTTQVVALPPQPPDQPMNAEPALAVAVSVTLSPNAKVLLQVLPQAMPEGLLVTGPLPLPALAIASVRTAW